MNPRSHVFCFTVSAYRYLSILLLICYHRWMFLSFYSFVCFKTMATSTLFDDPSIPSFHEYPTRRPFLNAEITRNPSKPTKSYPESNAQGKIVNCQFIHNMLKSSVTWVTNLTIFRRNTGNFAYSIHSVVASSQFLMTNQRRVLNFAHCRLDMIAAWLMVESVKNRGSPTFSIEMFHVQAQSQVSDLRE